MKVLERMLTVFFDRHIADSTSAKPRFMKNTSAAVNRTHTVSKPTFRSAGVCANAGVATKVISAAPASSPGNFFFIVPPLKQK
jgi:hypothetical protein